MSDHQNEELRDILNDIRDIRFILSTICDLQLARTIAESASTNEQWSAYRRLLNRAAAARLNSYDLF